MASLDDVARAAGVSKSVASRALSGDAGARMREETRARVRQIAADLAYVPNVRARAFRSSRSGAIGLIVPDVNNAIFSEVFSGVQEAAAPRGTDILLGQVDAPSDGARQLARLVREGRIDGLLIQRREDFDDAAFAEVLAPDVPAVTINSRLPSRAGSVVLDDERGAATAADHLIGLGHRRIAMISGSRHHDTARRREAGFLSALARAGLAPAGIIAAGWEADAGASAMARILSGTSAEGRPSGIVVASANAAVGALSTALRAGVAVPGELSIVAINTTWVAATIYPALTTVDLPLRELGSRSATMLIDHLAGAALDDVVITEPAPRLHVRETTAAP